jgi:hypothetical protein
VCEHQIAREISGASDGEYEHDTLIMEAVRTSETSVYFNETTRRYNPEGCHLHQIARLCLNFYVPNSPNSITLKTQQTAV